MFEFFKKWNQQRADAKHAAGIDKAIEIGRALEQADWECYGRRRSELERVSSEWTDLCLSTAEPPAIRNPINIKRSMLQQAKHLTPGDCLTLHLITTDENGVADSERTPPIPIDRQIVVDSVTKFEVIDEFGVDVGIGFVLGEAKKERNHG